METKTNGTVRHLIGVGRGGLTVGRSESNGKIRRTVTAVGQPYWHSREDCEEQDCHCYRPGWRTPYTAIDEPIQEKQ